MLQAVPSTPRSPQIDLLFIAISVLLTPCYLVGIGISFAVILIVTNGGLVGVLFAGFVRETLIPSVCFCSPLGGRRRTHRVRIAIA